MMLNRSTRPSRNCKLNRRHAIFLLVTLLGAGFGKAADLLLIADPAFYRYAPSEPIEGTTKTVFDYYRAEGENLVSAVPADSDARQTAKRDSTAHGRALLQHLDPEVIRDSRGTVTALCFRSDDPTLSTILLLPELGNRYRRVLGPDCLVAIPNRQTIFLFPRLAVKVQSFAEQIQSLYHNSPWPVSTEIFEFTDGKLRAKGVFNENF
jgi:hypothetical protein